MSGNFANFFLFDETTSVLAHPVESRISGIIITRMKYINSPLKELSALSRYLCGMCPMGPKAGACQCADQTPGAIKKTGIVFD
jgi:hypothetical protein